MAAWSIRHPVGVIMIALALVALGLLSLGRLGVDLLPNIIYPEIGIRVTDPGVPAGVMEDRITRQVEEQLAITEDAIAVQSQTSEGRSALELSFPYGKDIDLALRDASTRLDRARRLLPGTIEAPVIFKRDPSQIPVAEFAVGSPLRDPVALRDYLDYDLSKWFLNLPGVAAAEVGGGLEREILVQPDPQRLHALGLDLNGLLKALRGENLEMPAGRLETSDNRASTRLAARVKSVAELAALRVPLPGQPGQSVRLDEIAQVLDSHADERLRIRLDGQPAMKLSIQKQPTANTVAVVDAVHERLAWLREQKLLPPDIVVQVVDDQSVYVRQALKNAASAALGGALLAMLVVYLFLGDLRRTLVIGTSIPIALVVTFMLMDLAGLTLNLMTLGGLALGVGMLVDSAIVMLENITRHQHDQPSNAGGDPHLEHLQSAILAAREVNSPIVASTSTNLAAILPFLFIGGLIGLLFRELIFTIAAAMIAAVLVAITLVPALAAKVPPQAESKPRPLLTAMQNLYVALLRHLIRWPWLIFLVFSLGLAFAVQQLAERKQIFLPEFDEGRINISVIADSGISLEAMDHVAERLENLIREQPETASVFSVVGGMVFGRSQNEASHRSSLSVRLRPLAERSVSSGEWIKRLEPQVQALQLVGVQVRMRTVGIRGIRLSRGDDDLSLRIQGDDLDQLYRLGEELVARIKDVPGLRNAKHSSEELTRELAVEIDRERASALGFTQEDIGNTLKILLGGESAGEYLEGDRQYTIRLRLPPGARQTPQDLSGILLHGSTRQSVRLGELAAFRWVTTPSQIIRDNQRRIVEISGSLEEGAALEQVLAEVYARLADFVLPEGYALYDAGAAKSLKEGRNLAQLLLVLAVFLVFVVMAVQYESLRNPLIILLSVPFSLTGVALGLYLHDLPLSMPIWLGLIMLAGMLVNNTIVLVETIELQRKKGQDRVEAMLQAARLRLRPIFMTTLSTVVGLLPLAVGLGEGTEMLRPLAVAIVYGLSFSLLVSLLLAPALYKELAAR